MKHFLKIFDGIDPLPALMQLQEKQHLWDEFTVRTDDQASPHHGASDIWLRYRARKELKKPADYIKPHFPAWWPAWHVLPALHPIVHGIAARCQATAIGGCFLTRIPPGGEIKPHDDAYSWHAQFYPFKVYVPLASNGRVVNRCEDEEVVFSVGSAWYFNNLVEHAVRNDGDSERITLIVSMRRE